MAVFSGFILIAILFLAKPSWSAPSKASKGGDYQYENEQYCESEWVAAQCINKDLAYNNDIYDCSDYYGGYNNDALYYDELYACEENLDYCSNDYDTSYLDKEYYQNEYCSNGKLWTCGVNWSCYKNWDTSKESTWESCTNTGANSCYKDWYTTRDDYNYCNKYSTEDLDYYTTDIGYDCVDYDWDSYYAKNIDQYNDDGYYGGSSCYSQDQALSYQECEQNAVECDDYCESNESTYINGDCLAYADCGCS